MLHAHFPNKIHSATGGTNESTFALIYLTLIIFFKGSFRIKQIFGIKVFGNIYTVCREETYVP